VLTVGAASFAVARSPGSRDVQELAGPAVFEEVWQTVRQHFFDPGLNGLDWPAVQARYRPALLAAGSPDARAAVINATLAELHASHTEYLLPDQEPQGEVTYPGIGIFTNRDEQGRVFVTGVIDGQPAARADVLLGDEMIEVDDAPFHPIDAFRGKVANPPCG
jgi:carboxyl-terminal processing protease